MSFYKRMSRGFGFNSSPVASEVMPGVVEIATQAEVNTGTNDDKAVSPLKLHTYLELTETASRTIYVETTGNDTTGDGLTVGTAFATIGKALSTVKKRVTRGIDITIQCGLGTFNMGADDFDLWSKIAGKVMLMGTMTLVNSGFTVGAAEALDPLSFNITGGDSATWTLDQWKWYYIKQGTNYYPITGNTAGPNPVLSLTTTAPINEIYENGTTVNFTFTGTDFEVGGNKLNEIYFYYIKFIFPDSSFSVSSAVSRWHAYSCNFVSASSARYFYLYPTTAVYYCSFNNFRIAGSRAPVAFRNIYAYLNANSNIIQLWGDVDSYYVKSLSNVVLENPNTGSGSNCIYLAGSKRYYGESTLSYIKFLNSNVAIKYVGSNNIFSLNRIGTSTIIIKNTNYLVRRINAADDYQSLQLVLNSSAIVGSPNTRWFYDSMYEFVNLTSGRNIHITGVLYPEIEFNQKYTWNNNTSGNVVVGKTAQNYHIEIDYIIARGALREKGTVVLTNAADTLIDRNFVFDDAGITLGKLIVASDIQITYTVSDAVDNAAVTFTQIRRSMITPLTI